jgi:hypothetical protein
MIVIDRGFNARDTFNEIRPRKARDVGAIYDIRYGSFEAPDDFAFKRTGTIDSFIGRVLRLASAAFLLSRNMRSLKFYRGKTTLQLSCAASG